MHFQNLDRRLDGWPLMDSMTPTVLMCLGYVILVKYVGPWLMQDRKPFELKKVLIVYNAAQVIFSAWQFYEVSPHML